MNIKLIDNKCNEYAKEQLTKLYEDNFTPAEKKEYLPNHSASYGPYMAITDGNENKYLLDAASQIATLGLGFNPTAFFGTSMHQSAWSGNYFNSTFIEISNSFENILKEKANNDKLKAIYVNSGAEANSTALIMSYQKRANPQAKKIIAFEGSFHGRFLSTLFSTWNKVKREPFQIPGHETTFIKYPETKSTDFNFPIEDSWRRIWENPFKTNFTSEIDKLAASADELLKSEIDSLLDLKKELDKKESFAILIEPMQCEGGDRYSTSRFHTALVLLAKSYQVPVIYDEVQTGFGLGRDFFWHRSFDLKDSRGKQLNPEYIICAKKAQTGIVLTEDPLWLNNEFQTSSLIRGYYQAIAIDQLRYKVKDIEELCREKLMVLTSKWKQLSSPRCFGLAFAFDIDDSTDIPKFISSRFECGLLFYQAGSNTLRFRLNTSWKNQDINYLFKAIDALADKVYNQKEIPSDLYIDHQRIEVPNIENEYQWHKNLIKGFKSEIEQADAMVLCEEFFKNNFDLTLINISTDNFSKYKEAIQQIQIDTYEALRQTEIEKFEKIANDSKSYALGILNKQQELIGISFAGKIQDFPHESGLRQTKHFNTEGTLYMLDTTVVASNQQHGLGKFLKYALTLIASTGGAKYIYGRNRDMHAGAMLSINCSLGAIVELRLKDNYLDNEVHRDVIIYRQNLKWEENESYRSSSPILNSETSASFINNAMPVMINKVCLSNFIDETFIESLNKLKDIISPDLKHIFTTSGHSECIDKIFKSLYVKTNKKRTKVLSIEGQYFGKHSLMSATLSGVVDFFPNKKIESSNELSSALEANDILAVFIESYQYTQEELAEIVNVCHANGTKVVFNETTYFHTNKTTKSLKTTIVPDASYIHFGGQLGLCMFKDEYYENKPLMMISTWDGDTFTLMQTINFLEGSSSKKFEELDNNSYQEQMRAKNIFGNRGPLYYGE